jgi:hypothetical protein
LRSVIHLADIIRENARGVDHRTCLDLVLGTTLQITDYRPGDQVAFLNQGNDRHVIDRDTAEVKNRLSQVDGQT